MSDKKPVQISVCIDCIHFLAQTRGEFKRNNPDVPDEHIDHIESCVNEMRQQGYDVQPGGADELPFSKSECELCFSELHGSRHEAILMPIRNDSTVKN